MKLKYKFKTGNEIKLKSLKLPKQKWLVKSGDFFDCSILLRGQYETINKNIKHIKYKIT